MESNLVTSAILGTTYISSFVRSIYHSLFRNTLTILFDTSIFFRMLVTHNICHMSSFSFYTGSCSLPVWKFSFHQVRYVGRCHVKDVGWWPTQLWDVSDIVPINLYQTFISPLEYGLLTQFLFFRQLTLVSRGLGTFYL